MSPNPRVPLARTRADARILRVQARRVPCDRSRLPVLVASGQRPFTPFQQLPSRYQGRCQFQAGGFGHDEA